MRSHKPEAKESQRWVTHEVLPTVHKTGGYIPASESDSDEAIIAKALPLAQKTIEHNAQQLHSKDRQIMELEPKAQALDDFPNVEDKLLVRDAAKIFSNPGTPISEKQLREWMSDNDWTYKADGTKFAFPPTVRITRKGLALLHKRIGETSLNKALETTTH